MHVRRPGGALVWALLVTVGTSLGCATPGVQGIETDLDEIQEQLFRVQKENAVMAETITSMREAVMGASGPSAARSNAEFRLRLESIDRELAALRTRQDEGEQRLAALVQDLRTTRDALQALLQSMPVPAAGPHATTTATPPGPGVVPPGPMAPGGIFTGGMPASAPPALGGADPQESPAGSSPVVPEVLGGALVLEDLFRQGYADYTRGNYELALQELGEFSRRYPTSDLADDARYLMGEIHYSQSEYAEAVTAFDSVVQNYPRGDKAGLAYLKKGLALLEMNRTADAVIQLQHVITAYPGSEEARIARDRLRGLGLTER